MANKVLVTIGTNIVIANSTYSPGTNTTLGARTDDIDVDGLGTGAARQGVKFDFGQGLDVWARRWMCMSTFEMASDPAAGGNMQYFVSPSISSTPAVGNAGGATGADAAYTGYSGSTLAEGLAQMQRVGLPVNVAIQNDTDGVQIAVVGIFTPTHRYGSLITFNNTSVGLHSDSIEAAFRFAPLPDEIQ